MKKFFLGFLIYLGALLLLHFFFWSKVQAIGMVEEMSGRIGWTSQKPYDFFVDKFFGFPLNQVFPYHPMGSIHIGLTEVLIFLGNCILQYFFIYWLITKIKLIIFKG